MRSKYAPIAALAALAIIVVLAIGWFLLIKPQLAQASDLHASKDEVEASTAKVQTATKRLDRYAEDLAALAPLDEALVLNAPPTFDVEQVRDRVIEAARSAKVGIASMALESTLSVDGWVVQASERPSTSVAKLFQDEPFVPDDEISVPEGWEEYTPPLKVPGGEASVVDGMYAVPVEVSVAGSYERMARFLRALSDPDEQLFLVASIEVNARNEGSSEIPSIASAQDGDVIMTLTGHLYLLDPSGLIADEAVGGSVSPAKPSPFEPSAPAGDQT